MKKNAYNINIIINNKASIKLKKDEKYNVYKYNII